MIPCPDNSGCTGGTQMSAASHHHTWPEPTLAESAAGPWAFHLQRRQVTFSSAALEAPRWGRDDGDTSPQRNFFISPSFFSLLWDFWKSLHESDISKDMDSVIAFVILPLVLTLVSVAKAERVLFNILLHWNSRILNNLSGLSGGLPWWLRG